MAKSTRIRIFLKTECFFLRFSLCPPYQTYMEFSGTEKACFQKWFQSGDFFKRRLLVYVWADENEGFRRR